MGLAEVTLVFAYLKPFPALPQLLQRLSERHATTLVFAPDLDPVHRQRFEQPEGGQDGEGAPGRIAFADAPVDLAAAARACDLALLNGTHAATSVFLQAGKPMLHIPLNLEQGLTARAIRLLGAGLDAAGDDTDRLIARLDRLLESLAARPSDSYTQAARRAAAAMPNAASADSLVDLIARL